MARISLKVNGRSRVVDTDPNTPLLYVLRDELGLNGPKFGCGLSQCGCCTEALGAGEPSIVPVPAAIANAVFDATGMRFREVPLTPERVLSALKGGPALSQRA